MPKYKVTGEKYSYKSDSWTKIVKTIKAGNEKVVKVKATEYMQKIKNVERLS